ncbi:MAG TPA: 23S rRNA (pseudouridine(1915)-N(3))-methyltransferase RlmH [Crocinitomicaceae bacterium]|nr:23S rRNA (pseudouridine(1915)-N(3))-methyltransferase RlmH [Crocinitomicaceae bacterium]
MKIKLICVGKTTSSYLIEGENEYLKRLKHFTSVEKIEIPELKNVKKMSENEIKKQEGELILKKIATSDYLILLDENGTEFNSVGFSKFLQKRMNSGAKTIVFVIGGAYGFSEEIYNKAQSKIALSKMTFSHQMVRVFFLEQIYRGFSILKGMPYHHE